jgi:hypothetical protein
VDHVSEVARIGQALFKPPGENGLFFGGQVGHCRFPFFQA